MAIVSNYLLSLAQHHRRAVKRINDEGEACSFAPLYLECNATSGIVVDVDIEENVGSRHGLSALIKNVRGLEWTARHHQWAENTCHL